MSASGAAGVASSKARLSSRRDQSCSRHESDSAIEESESLPLSSQHQNILQSAKKLLRESASPRKIKPGPGGLEGGDCPVQVTRDEEDQRQTSFKNLEMSEDTLDEDGENTDDGRVGQIQDEVSGLGMLIKNKKI